jgi:hypothetical protein
MKKSKLEKSLDGLMGAGEKSGGFLGWFTKNFFVTLISIVVLLTLGTLLFLANFGKGFHKKIRTKAVDPHYVVE